MVNQLCGQGYRTLEEGGIGLDSHVSKALLKDGGFVLSLEIWVGFRELDENEGRVISWRRQM